MQTDNVYLEQWIIWFGIPSHSITDNGTQLVGKLLASIFSCLDVKHLTATAFHQQSNAQAKWYDRTVIK